MIVDWDNPQPRSLTASEATGFIRGGMLFLEPPHRWRIFDREIWRRCARRETQPRRIYGRVVADTVAYASDGTAYLIGRHQRVRS
jgi:hypothetical protein